MYPGINCTNYAAFVESQVYGVPTPGVLMGDAYQWADRAAEAGIPVDDTPTVGSVAVWGADAPGMGGYGHVAVVESVGPDGSYIDVSQSGMGTRTTATTGSASPAPAAPGSPGPRASSTSPVPAFPARSPRRATESGRRAHDGRRLDRASRERPHFAGAGRAERLCHAAAAPGAPRATAADGSLTGAQPDLSPIARLDSPDRLVEDFPTSQVEPLLERGPVREPCFHQRPALAQARHPARVRVPGRHVDRPAAPHPSLRTGPLHPETPARAGRGPARCCANNDAHRRAGVQRR